MKHILVGLAALAVSACAGVTFDRGHGQGKVADIGLPFHESKPYLLVTRSGAKDGGVESKIIYLPDLSTTYYARFKEGIGSSNFTLSLTDGRLTSFNQQLDSKLPELLANLVAPVKGLGEASASFANADLTKAQTDKLLAELASGGSKAEIFSSSALKPFFLGTDRCVSPPQTPPLPPPPSHNPQLNDEQARQLVIAIRDLACADQIFSTITPAKREVVQAALVSLLKIYDKDFLQSDIAFTLVVLEKHPTATALRTAAGPLKDFDVGSNKNPATTEGQIESRAKSAAATSLAVADALDPPKPSGVKYPFELYEIVQTGSKIELKKVTEPEEPKKPPPT